MDTGALFAQGEVIAFTDDDCRPDEYWLFNAKKYFLKSDVVGVEGMIVSDHPGDCNWRPVVNVGFEGIGFMTANFMVRSSIFQKIGGFDLQFDRPHFREDTDLGWRIQEYGQIPYARDVTVFHPAQPRVTDRESAGTRAKFFQKDAILYKKFPNRYQDLFYRECHFEHTEGFIENLLEGFARIGLAVPDWISETISSQKRKTIP